ncbi:MAG: hypothetical protein ACI9SC_002652, partial [Gammaproteobacteria bacterium]
FGFYLLLPSLRDKNSKPLADQQQKEIYATICLFKTGSF